MQKHMNQRAKQYAAYLSCTAKTNIIRSLFQLQSKAIRSLSQLQSKDQNNTQPIWPAEQRATQYAAYLSCRIAVSLQRLSVEFDRVLKYIENCLISDITYYVTICETHYYEKKRNISRLVTKPTKWHVRPAKTQISLGIRPVWSESSLSAWRKLGSLATH